jgi:hypothetical protein
MTDILHQVLRLRDRLGDQLAGDRIAAEAGRCGIEP